MPRTRIQFGRSSANHANRSADRPNVLSTTYLVPAPHPAWLRSEGEGSCHYGHAGRMMPPGSTLDQWRALVRERAGRALDGSGELDARHLAPEAVRAATRDAVREWRRRERKRRREQRER